MKRMKRIMNEQKALGLLFFLAVLYGGTSTYAQERQDNAWKAVFTDFSLSATTTLRVETHLRTRRFFAENDQYLFRPSLGVKLNAYSSLSGGFTLLSTNQSTQRLFERNLWQQFAFSLPVRKSRFFGWIRLEQRWQSQGDQQASYSSRIRFRTGFEHPLGKAKAPSLVVFNEVFLVLDQGFPYHYNQNWTFVGVKHRWSKKLVHLSGFQRNTIAKADGFLHKNIWSTLLFYRPF